MENTKERIIIIALVMTMCSEFKKLSRKIKDGTKNGTQQNNGTANRNKRMTKPN